MGKQAAVGMPRRLAGMAIQLAMAGVFAFWIIILMLRATRPYTDFNTNISNRLMSAVYGNSASWLLLFSGPVFVLVVLSALYPRTAQPSKIIKRLGHNGGRPRSSIWTYPVFVRGPLGIVSVAELIWLFLFLSFLVFIYISYLDVGFNRINARKIKIHLWQARLDTAAVRMGLLGYVAMAFLFIPVSRGSVLLRLINIPFEHAVKYHKWIAVIMMAILVSHGGLFVALWRSEHVLAQELRMWNRNGVNQLAGVISLMAGILMSIMAIPQVRLRYFEAFYFTHQLYIVFVAFAMMHTGERHFTVVMAGVFLFALDRFLRFMQSRKTVDLLAVRNLPGGTMELVFPKHPGVEYRAASFIFLQIPGLAHLQWHPFTLASSSIAEPDRMSILVKRHGAWTQALEKLVDQTVDLASSSADKRPSCPFGFKASIEGPYGHESDYFLKYDSILFIAGGSGISPFVSILKDLLHRYYDGSAKHQDLPTEVILVWAVRNAKELHVLDTVSVPAGLEKSGLRLHFLAYVTREESPDMESEMETLQLEDAPQVYNSKPTLDPLFPEVGRDSNVGIVIVVVASLMGYFLVWGLLGYYYINQDAGKDPYPSWAEGLFSLLSMLLGITFFGGIAALIWSMFVQTRRSHSKHQVVQVEMSPSHSSAGKVADAGLHQGLLKRENVHFGSRPNFRDIFADTANRLAGSNVGVMVCGPETMKENVAYHCQANSSLLGGPVAFHFHSVSFEL